MSYLKGFSLILCIFCLSCASEEDYVGYDISTIQSTKPYGERIGYRTEKLAKPSKKITPAIINAKGEPIEPKYETQEPEDDAQEEVNQNNQAVEYDTEYYPNGNIKAKVAMKDGKKNGEWIGYYPNGNIAGKGNFKNDKEHGKFLQYHQNGKLGAEMNFKDGQPHGVHIMYDNNGNIVAKVTFDQGVPIKQEAYRNGKLIKQEKFK